MQSAGTLLAHQVQSSRSPNRGRFGLRSFVDVSVVDKCTLAATSNVLRFSGWRYTRPRNQARPWHAGSYWGCWAKTGLALAALQREQLSSQEHRPTFPR